MEKIAVRLKNAATECLVFHHLTATEDGDGSHGLTRTRLIGERVFIHVELSRPSFFESLARVIVLHPYRSAGFKLRLLLSASQSASIQNPFFIE
jgi:hypothetical protein